MFSGETAIRRAARMAVAEFLKRRRPRRKKTGTASAPSTAERERTARSLLPNVFIQIARAI